MRVLFWGTPAFALPSFRALTDEGHDVVGVVTRPDRPAGRGRHVQSSEVKQEAEEIGTPIFQPDKPSEPEFTAAIEALAPDVSVVVAYGALLPDHVLAIPGHGSVNVHASLLPELRGAAPVNWAIIRGHERSGVTIMRMVREMDAGPILAQLSIDLDDETTAGELSMVLSELGAELLIETLAAMESGQLRERDQDNDAATYAPKLDKTMARLDWTSPATDLARWVRGCDPRPGAWSELRGSAVQLFDPWVEEGDWNEVDPPTGEPGTVLEAEAPGHLLIETGTGTLRIGAVKPSGRRRMAAADWVRGRGAEAGDRFE
jgi:methionyl-tRNA formyltransferase